MKEQNSLGHGDSLPYIEHRVKCLIECDDH